ncbi:MAG: alanine/glycine:cation symporter family protein [Moraxella sp.]|nr:alanine/glycine:cation symporter family protein [Moraxella sp.]
MNDVVSVINGWVWSWALVALCLGVGLFYSVMTRFVQVRMLGEMVHLLSSTAKSKDGISPFQAFVLALSGRVGIGNISGVAAAIGFGGPSAVFWLAVVAFLGASTAYAESTLAQVYKEQDLITGQYRGGPAYYFEKGLGQKWFAILFALMAIVSCGVFLPGVQVNSVVSAITHITGEGADLDFLGMQAGHLRVMVMVFIVCILGMIIVGGVARISAFAELIVPLMAGGYVFLALLLMVINLDKVPLVVALIVSDIFNPMAGLGAAVGWGVKRGVYSSEAGQGTGPHHAGAAEVEHPAQQGLVQASSVYVDTFLMCAATAFMILTMDTYNVQGNLSNGQFLIQHVDASTEIDTPIFTQMALEATFGSFGAYFTAIAVSLFAFTTVMAYYHIAEINVVYLARFFGKKAQKFALWFVKISVLIMAAYGSLNHASVIWAWGDVGVGMTAWLNILGVLVMFFMLSKPVIAVLDDYEQQKQAGVSTYVFDPLKLGIKNAAFWEERLKKQKK